MNTMPNQFGLDLKNSSLLDDASVARLYASEAISMMRRSGYTVTMEFHLGDWADIMANIPDRVMLNPAFDPTHSDLDPSNSFWLRVSDRNGTVAIIADKLVECDDYLVEMAAGRIYYRDPGPEQTIVLEPNLPMGRYSGRVGCAGGLWVHPRARKQGLSWILPRLVRAYSIQFWDVYRHCAVVFEGTRNAGLVEKVYGFKEIHLMCDGYFPPNERNETIHVIHIDRSSIIRQFLADLESLTARAFSHLIESSGIPFLARI